jgi:L-lactate dehydrogenase complex protein LldG
MNAREKILGKLKQAQKPFTDVPPPATRLPMVLQPDITPHALKTRFIAEAQKLSCQVHDVNDDEGAIQAILHILGADTSLMAWDWAHIPVKGLQEALAHLTLAEMRDKEVRVGLTGADAGLASTGSVVLTSGAGKPRQASLLPNVHVCVLRAQQIIPDLETWFATQRAHGLDNFRHTANAFVISGPSRTADIAMELIMGMHGPRDVHVVLIG